MAKISLSTQKKSSRSSSKTRAKVNNTTGFNYEAPPPLEHVDVNSRSSCLKDEHWLEGAPSPRGIDNPNCPIQSGAVVMNGNCTTESLKVVSRPSSPMNQNFQEVSPACHSLSTEAVVSLYGDSPCKECTSNDQEGVSKSVIRRTRKFQNNLRAKVRVKYDMNKVPNVQRNIEFLKKWRELEGTHCVEREEVAKPLNCDLSPLGNDSVIWVPSSRVDWEDCVDEMTSACTAAAWRRYCKSDDSREFYPPLSRIYIRDRVDIDDPLRGFQVRHREGGWLQGFVMLTDFTTWTHYFKWDSKHPESGMEAPFLSQSYRMDDGCLALELERQPRSGDPLDKGVIWSTIAEISLVGALGCGEYLLHMALDDIRRRGNYRFAVLQATDQSRPFYEKFGFTRVGAISKYGTAQDMSSGDSQLTDGAPPIVGYRHWAHAHETTKLLDKHGGPSYMMAKRIDVSTTTNESIIDSLAGFFVEGKPKIQPLGSVPKRKRSFSTSRIISSEDFKKTSFSGRRIKPAKRLLNDDETLLKKSPHPRTKRVKTNLCPNTISDVKVSEKNLTLPPSSTSQPRTNSNFSSQQSPKNSSIPTQSSSRDHTPSLISESSVNYETKPKLFSLRKQKILSMYRDPRKIYYYNKVVTPVDGSSISHIKSEFYFVLNYNEEKQLIRIIPLYTKGTFKGKREGRTKWKARVQERRNALDPLDSQGEKMYFDSMDIITVPCNEWKIVQASMVTKCAGVKEESWDLHL